MVNVLIAVCRTKEEVIEYMDKVKKNCEGMKPDGAVYEEYISQILVECQESVVGYTGLRQDDYCAYTDMCCTIAYNV